MAKYKREKILLGSESHTLKTFLRKGYQANYLGEVEGEAEHGIVKMCLTRMLFCSDY